ncbi:MAG TPA: beta-ketoacyl-ACP synthase II [Anaerolineales bacterium]|nr:beta-ketoacyl-ACP synthase II [Anaerolineales bacterium]
MPEGQTRVVVTGMGTVNPLGLTVEETWERAVRGESGVGPITLFDSTPLAVHIAAEVKGFDPSRYMEMKETRRRDRFQLLAVPAVQQAMAQSGLTITPDNAARVGVIISSAVGGIGAIQAASETLVETGPRRLSPFLIPMMMSNGASGMTAMDFGAMGPTFSIASACASSNDAIGVGWTLLRAGMIEAAIVGGSEATLIAMGIAAFDRTGALSHRNEEYHLTPAPFDKERDGLVMGEGASALVIETEPHARARGARILAEVAGYGASADAFHVTAPRGDGGGGALAIVQALKSSGAAPDEIDYINAHGTGTQLNDLSETRAIKAALGEKAYDVPISSTKSMTGHMMGATGALEAIFCVQVIRTGLIPPTAHLHTPDPECDLDYVPLEPRRRTVRFALSNAFGFGGHNSVLAFRAY